jgi:hypothetical protein
VDIFLTTSIITYVHIWALNFADIFSTTFGSGRSFTSRTALVTPMQSGGIVGASLDILRRLSMPRSGRFHPPSPSVFETVAAVPSPSSVDVDTRDCPSLASRRPAASSWSFSNLERVSRPTASAASFLLLLPPAHCCFKLLLYICLCFCWAGPWIVMVWTVLRLFQLPSFFRLIYFTKYLNLAFAYFIAGSQ